MVLGGGAVMSLEMAAKLNLTEKYGNCILFARVVFCCF